MEDYFNAELFLIWQCVVRVNILTGNELGVVHQPFKNTPCSLELLIQQMSPPRGLGEQIEYTRCSPACRTRRLMRHLPCSRGYNSAAAAPSCMSPVTLPGTKWGNVFAVRCDLVSEEERILVGPWQTSSQSVMWFASASISPRRDGWEGLAQPLIGWWWQALGDSRII